MADKDEFEVTRETTIPASRAAVYALLVDFHRWREWSPWEDIDPRLSRTYSGPDAGVGAIYEWVGNRKAGAGRMEITDVGRGVEGRRSPCSSSSRSSRAARPRSSWSSATATPT